MTKSHECEDQHKSTSTTHYFAENSFYMKTIFFIITLFLTATSTLVMSVSIMSDYWEYVTWNKQRIREIIENGKSTSHQDHVRIDSTQNDSIIKLSIIHNGDRNSEPTRLYLLPMHGGIWTVCVSLTEKQLYVLKHLDMPSNICFNYLSAKLFKAESETLPNWNYRLQNVSISCALVCLIILTLAALIGMFGVFKHQLIAILVTGVMYLLAGIFASFAILIIHCRKFDYKRMNYDSHNSMRITVDNGVKLMDYGILQHNKVMEQNTDLSYLWKTYYTAREFQAGSSSILGMVGVMFVLITSASWIFLARILRYTPPLTQLEASSAAHSKRIKSSSKKH